MAKNKVLVEFQIVQKGKNFSILQKEQEKHNKSLDQTDKKTKDLSKSQNNNYNRQKQGVIQTANSTKNFSKLSQTVGGDGGGPGGLVRAYALLAANVFALTAAFGVLSRSAQIDPLNQSMEVLSTTGGTYIKNLAKEMQEASGFAIDLAQSFRQVSLAASAGLNTSEIEGLTKVAKGAAISLGRNLPDAMDRIFRGAIKLEPEILDEIGLFVRVDEAAQKYARNNGKVVSALTQVEKRQAFLNEILEQGTKKFAQYADEIKPDPYVRLGAALGDIAQGGLSILNSVLGPVLNMLAESKILLGAVFGTLVLALLKKAIPAMGLFTQSQAEQANQAAQNAREYTQGLRENTDSAFKENKKRVTDETNTQRKLNRARKPLALKVGGKDASSKLEADLQNKKIKGAERIEKVEQRILDLTKKQRLEERKKLAGYDEELASLREEIRLEEELNRITKEGVLAVKKGGLADRRQQKLDRKAGGSSIIAMSTGVGETAGMREGFKSLTDGISAGFETVDEKGEKVTKQFSKFQAGALKAQGGASLLAGGISKLMMVMGPFLMVAALLAPVVMAIGKAMGFGRAEIKAYGESLTRLSDQIENIDKRFKKQTEQLRRGNLTYIESLKATLAFNKGQKETAENILKVSKAFDEVRRTAGFFTTLGDNFLGSLVWGKSVDGIQWMSRSKFKQTMATLEGGLKNLVGAARGDNAVITKVYTDQIEGAGDLVTSVKALAAAEDIQFQKKEEYYKLVKDGDEEALKSQKLIEKFVDKGKVLATSVREKKALEALTGASKDYVLSTINRLKADKETEKEMTSLGATADDYTAISEEVIKITDKEIKLLERLASAAQGASESIGKFQASFMPKTKVDDVLSSFKQFESAFADIREKAKDGEIDPKLADGFFKQFADADNAIGTLFKSLFHKVDGVMVLLDKSGDTAAAAFKNVVVVLNNFRDGILTTKIEIQSLKAQQKILNTLTMGGIEVNTLRQKKFTEELKKTAEMQRQLTSVAFVSFGLGVEEAGKLANSLAEEEDTANKRNVLQQAFLDKKINENQLSQATAFIEQEEMKRVDYLIAVEQESLLIKKEGLKAQQKINNAQKEFSNAKRAELELEAKLTSIKTRGTAALSPQAQADLDIDAAIRKRDLVIEESKIKLLLLDVEEKLLLARIDVLQREGKLVGVNVAALKSNVQRATSLQKSALSTIIGNATSQVAVDLAASTTKAFGGGLVNGAMAGTKALKVGLDDIEKRKKTARSKIMTDGFIAGDDIMGTISEATKSDKGFEQEKATLRQTQAMSLLRLSVEGTVEAFNKLGPDGIAAGAFLQGSMNIMDSAVLMNTEFALLDDAAKSGLEGMALSAQFAATAISNIGSILAANSSAQIAEIDKQIEAEKKRDGKSEQSVARMRALEAKKEAVARKAFNTQKKVSMASVALNTAAAIMQVMAAPGDPYKAFGIPMTYVIGALGAAQLAMIAGTSYAGGASNVDSGGAKATALNIGGRNNSVDTSRRASSGELAYIRGEKGSGSNANNFRSGGATGMKGYAAGQPIMVGEQGPERIDIVPNEDLGKSMGTTNINFNISAVDGQSVQRMLNDQQGNIIGMIQSAANETGEEFLPQVDPSVYGTGG